MRAAPSNTFTLEWSTVDGGGGLATSADGRWLLAGTAGQPDGGASEGGNFNLEGGFWNGVRCAYGLRITRFHDDSTPLGAEYVIVTWPADDQGDCVLESTTELNTDPTLNVWAPTPFFRSGPFNAYSYVAFGPAKFFRLRAGLPKVP